mgnify:CR=1 FL=1
MSELILGRGGKNICPPEMYLLIVTLFIFLANHKFLSRNDTKYVCLHFKQVCLQNVVFTYFYDVDSLS